MRRIVLILMVSLFCGAVMAQDKKEEAKPEAQPAAKPEKKMQTTCPVMTGEKINKKLFVDFEGKRIYVCCKGCIADVKKDPAKYIKEIEAAGFTLDTVPVEKKAEVKKEESKPGAEVKKEEPAKEEPKKEEVKQPSSTDKNTEK